MTDRHQQGSGIEFDLSVRLEPDYLMVKHNNHLYHPNVTRLSIEAEKNFKDKKLLLSQKEAIDYFTKKGIVLASLPDYYNEIKNVRSMKKEYRVLLESLINDSYNPGIVTSTSVVYQEKKTNWKTSGVRYIEAGEVMHYKGMEALLKKPIPHFQLDIPEFDMEELGLVFAQKKGIKFVQKLLNTDDSPDEILKTFGIFANRHSKKIMLRTTELSERKNRPSSVFFERTVHELIINCSNLLELRGIVREVRINDR